METHKGVTGAWGIEVFDQAYPGVSDWLLDQEQEKNPHAVYVFAGCGGETIAHSAPEWSNLRTKHAACGFVRKDNSRRWYIAWTGDRAIRGMESFAHFFEGLHAMPNPAR